MTTYCDTSATIALSFDFQTVMILHLGTFSDDLVAHIFKIAEE